MLAGIAVHVKLKAKIFPNPNRKAGLLLETFNLFQVKITQRAGPAQREGLGGGFSPPPPPPHFFTVKRKNNMNLSK